MAKSYRDRIGQLLDVLRDPLAAYARSRLTDRYGDDWVQAAHDIVGAAGAERRPDDPAEWDIQGWFHLFIGG